jgi:hypothetical protein
MDLNKLFKVIRSDGGTDSLKSLMAPFIKSLRSVASPDIQRLVKCDLASVCLVLSLAIAELAS